MPNLEKQPRENYKFGTVSKNAVRLFRDPEYRKSIEGQKTTVLPALFAWYFVSGQTINFFEALIYANAAFFTEDKLATAVTGALIGRGIPLIINPLSTLYIGARTKTDLREAAKFSAIPFAGPLLAIPAQLRKDQTKTNLSNDKLKTQSKIKL